MSNSVPPAWPDATEVNAPYRVTMTGMCTGVNYPRADRDENGQSRIANGLEAPLAFMIKASMFLFATEVKGGVVKRGGFTYTGSCLR